MSAGGGFPCLTQARTIFLLFISGSLLISCNSRKQNMTIEEISGAQSSKIERGARQVRGRQIVLPSSSNDSIQRQAHATPEFFEGTGKLVGTRKSKPKASIRVKSDGVTLNLVGVSVAEAAKAILGDILKLNYAVDQRVSGKLTLQTSAPVSPDGLLDIFETLLATKGAAIIESNGHYRVLPSEMARTALLPIHTKRVQARAKRPGVKIQVVPLRFVSATEIARVLTPIVPEGSILRIDETRNVLMLIGSDQELASMLEAVEIFDIDVMRGKSFALLPVNSADPDMLAEEMRTIFENQSGGVLEGVVRFLPNKRLNAILVITSRSKYLGEAEKWLARLDRAASRSEQRLFVYNIQNRPAAELVKILKDIFKDATVASAPDESTVAPRLTSETIRSAVQPGASVAAGGPAERPSLAGPPSALSFTDRPRAGTASSNGLRIVADEANNALLIMATPPRYRKILSVLQRIDVVPNQVLLEATIAEVSLKDELKLGLRWFFQKGNHDFTLTDAVSGAVAPVFPGFSYFFSTRNIDLVVNALASITDVNVISSPSLMVLDNRTAVLTVGDQVPVTTQSAVSLDSPGAPIVNSVEFRDTGVILSVTPRVNDSGRVVLEIEQEVSNVVRTTTSGIDSPTIQQRKIKTTVAIKDGESLALGGLMQERNTLTRGQVPLAGNIPIVGNLFKNKTDRIDRTELLIVIRPYVVRDMQEARDVTSEFRRQLNLDLRAQRGGPPTFRENLKRLLVR